MKAKHVKSPLALWRSQWNLQVGKEAVKIELTMKSGNVHGIQCTELLVQGFGSLVPVKMLVPLIQGFCVSTRTTGQLIFQGMNVGF